MVSNAKKYFLFVFAFLSIFTLLAIPNPKPVQAAYEWTGRTYFYPTYNRNIPVKHPDTWADNYGTIFASDECWFDNTPNIVNGYIKVTYPVPGSSKSGWIPVSEVLGSYAPNLGLEFKRFDASKRIITYKSPSSLIEYGYAETNDKCLLNTGVTIVDKNGRWLSCIRYPISGGNHKIGWVLQSETY